MAEPSLLLIKDLLQPGAYPHPVDEIQLLETHISWVILTGPYAYKIKKPVNLGFVDFSTLDKRKYYCEQELRLNRRLAPSLYIGVESINRSKDGVKIGANGSAIEYAVKMHQFDNNKRLDKFMQSRRPPLQVFTDLAHTLYQFHQTSSATPPDAALGSAEVIGAVVRENFTQIESCLELEHFPELSQVQQWCERKLIELADLFSQRQQTGFVRECHGDLHLANMVWWQHKICVFDCIEFNDSFRWIDVMSEIAFLVMDLEEKQHPDYANHFLNAYLTFSGDYEGLKLLNLYKIYRAMVRAKVAAIQAAQNRDNAERYQGLLQELKVYLNVAARYTEPAQAALYITHGLSGSGKSTVAEELAKGLSAIHIRSDVERKRLRGVALFNSSGSAPGSNLYTAEMTKLTYDRLLELSRMILGDGLPVIADATFLNGEQRRRFRELAAKSGVPFFILHTHANTNILMHRLDARAKKSRVVSEADKKILEMQLGKGDSLADEESACLVDIDTGGEINYEKLARKLSPGASPGAQAT